MSAGFYHWIWVVARVLSRKLGDGSYSKLVVLLGEEIFLGLMKKYNFPWVKKNILFFYQKSQKKIHWIAFVGHLNALCIKNILLLRQMTRLLRLGLFHCTGNLGGPNFVLSVLKIFDRYMYLYCIFIETIEIWQKWKKQEMAILSFKGMLLLWSYLTDDVDHHLHNHC